MEFIVEKIGMSRTISVPSVPVTLLKIKDAKVCEILEDGRAIVAYSHGKRKNKPIEGQQKKYGLSSEYNRFATLKVAINLTADTIMCLRKASLAEVSKLVLWR